MKLTLLLLLFSCLMNNLQTAVSTTPTCSTLPPHIATYHVDHNSHIRLSFTLDDGEIVAGATFRPTTDGQWQTSINPSDVSTQCPQQLALFLIYTLGTLETAAPPFIYTNATADFAAYTHFLVTQATAVPPSPHRHYLPILTT